MTNNPLKDEPIKPKDDSTGKQEEPQEGDPSPVEETDEDDLPF